MAVYDSMTCAIVTFNSEKVIQGCLVSLRKQLDDHRIIVYDNASKDATVERVAALSASIRVICGKRNLGFGRAINALRSEVQTPCLLLLNPDAVLRPGAIQELADLAEQLRQAAVLGAVQLTPEGGYVGPAPSEGRYQEVECIFGAAMLLRLAHFPRDSPLFDPRFWMYFEDQDLCLSAIRRGHQVVLANQAAIVHEPGTSSALQSAEETLAIKRRQYLEYLVSGHVFAFKHQGKARALARAACLVLFCYGKYLYLLLRQRPQRYLVYQRSLASFLFFGRIFLRA
jgi:N-acetylglucosaminyl-diphospho-decaprenol L-rhamnosyltransferase